MVSYKGFNVKVASQIDAHPLPEFSTAHGLGASSTVACYIPIYPGAQIWIEYSVDRPQPSEAIYVFKLFISGHFVTSWDCTSKYGFKGKTIYSLHSAKNGNFTGSTVGQCSLQYNTQDVGSSPNTRDNCIELRVHRVDARKRIHGPVDVPAPRSLLLTPNAVRLCDSGYIDRYQPARRYQYLLIDAQDEPYATFRFYCRTIDYLERHGILDMRSSSPVCIATSASQYFDIDTSPSKGTPSSLGKDKAIINDDDSPRSPSSRIYCSGNLDRLVQRPQIPRSESCSSGSIIKDSIEDLPSMVVRMLRTSSSYTPTTKQASLGSDGIFDSIVDPLPVYSSPTKASSPLLPPVEALRIRKRTFNPLPALNGTVQDKIYKETEISVNMDESAHEPLNNLRSSSAASTQSVSRPLSPFTSGGFLRRLISHGDTSTDKNSGKEAQTGKGWMGSKRHVSNPERVSSQRSHSKLGFFGRKSAV